MRLAHVSESWFIKSEQDLKKPKHLAQCGSFLVGMDCYQSPLDTNVGFYHLALRRNCDHIFPGWVARHSGCAPGHMMLRVLWFPGPATSSFTFLGQLGFFCCLTFNTSLQMIREKVSTASLELTCSVLNTIQSDLCHSFIYSKQYFLNVSPRNTQ